MRALILIAPERVVPLDQGQQAFELLTKSPGKTLKVVLSVVNRSGVPSKAKEGSQFQWQRFLF